MLIPMTIANSRCCSFLFVLLLSTVGCSSGYYPVTGKVTYPDGSPVVEGTVIAETKSSGMVSLYRCRESSKDGSFMMGTKSAGDGVLPGKYRAMVMPPGLGDAELAEGKLPAVDSKFGSFDTSGLSFEATQGPTNVEFKVTRPWKMKLVTR